ncbi:unnamed protein product [Phaedon cochleariae]|uniref:Uncharacterized protein n=1 Tax=Phaedon cochleariae TaxID=80249 RepID=A0A9N9X301_PHACE|nr:unnamed protein product [Phaedon cochleariae]
MATTWSNSSSFSDFHEEEEEYIPSESENVSTDTDNEVELPQTPFKGRKRKSHPELSKQGLRKRQVKSGEEHLSSKNNLVRNKGCILSNCCRVCKLNCPEKISEIRQMEIFRHFYAIDWTAKDAFISGQIIVEPAKRKFSKKEVSRRQKTRTYRLQDVDGNDHRVCEVFFKSVLDVCDGKITKALKRKSASGTPVSDKRGRHTPHNKTNLEDTNYLKEFITKFPVYESHNCRHHTAKKYLPPNLNISLMYAEYKRCCETDQRKISSLFVFRDVFNHSFDLSFHRPQKSTCQKCDNFNIILKTELDDVKKRNTELEKTLHQRKAGAVKTLKKKEIDEAKNSIGLKHVAVFDLQRTLPVPALSTSVAYYKRQMWVFNLCIHDEVRNVGHMFIWDESIASRGAQEIVSCLIKYISLLPDTPNKIINLYSDACGGHRNIKVVLGLLDELQKNGVGVKEINLKFFVSGHSFSTCDQNFGVIDKEKKYHENIYKPDDWVSVIRHAKKK